MLHLGSTYLIVKDMNKSIEFYSKLLQMNPTARNFNRWTQFDFEGKCIALYSDSYDEEFICKEKEIEIEEHYNEEYLKWFKERNITYGNNFVLNFVIEDLIEEYERLCKLNIGEMSKIMYVNIAAPYYFFTITDPDGNTIEITGENTGIILKAKKSLQDIIGKLDGEEIYI